MRAVARCRPVRVDDQISIEKVDLLDGALSLDFGVVVPPFDTWDLAEYSDG